MGIYGNMKPIMGIHWESIIIWIINGKIRLRMNQKAGNLWEYIPDP